MRPELASTPDSRSPHCLSSRTNLTHTCAGLHLGRNSGHRRVPGAHQPRSLPDARPGRQEARTAASRSAESLVARLVDDCGMAIEYRDQGEAIRAIKAATGIR